MKIVQLVVVPLATNCYLITEEESGQTLVVDPGAEPQAILDAATDLGGRIQALICTHGHPDHTGALRQVVAATGAPVYIHSADSLLLRRTWPEYFVTEAPAGAATEVRELREGDTVEAGPLSLRVVHTPGHTPGGICLVAEEVAFTGDTLFAGSVGRSDLPGGDAAQLEDSLRRLARELSPITLIYPGHGDSTIMTQELAGNPWLNPKTETNP